jgi:hypothetical protein
MGSIDPTQSLDNTYYSLYSVYFESDTVQRIEANHVSGGGSQILELAGDSSGYLMLVTDMPSSGLSIGDEWSFGTVYTYLDNVGDVAVTATNAPFWLSGQVVGPGGIIKTGSGTLKLAPATGSTTAYNDYTGGFTLDAGTVEISENTDVLTRVISKSCGWPRQLKRQVFHRRRTRCRRSGPVVSHSRSIFASGIRLCRPV